MSDNLARRSVRSVTWNMAGNSVGIVLSFVQIVVLSRLLPVETFGIYAVAQSAVRLVLTNASFGMGSALVHRAPETSDIEQAAAVHFTLKLVNVLALGGLILLATLVFTDDQQPDLRTALLVITITGGIVHLTHTPRIMLVRQVLHRRVAVINTTNIALTALISVGLALTGATLWALLASNIISALVTVAGFYIWQPVWWPVLRWDRRIARYFLRYGSRNVVAHWLFVALDNLDDLFTGVILGSVAAGFYARAYRLAKYPSAILARPINRVAEGTYAELKEDRKALSTAFTRTNTLMVRSGFLMAGLLALLAPEIVLIVLGEKWLPMLDVFRLMLIYTLFEPMKQTIGGLFLAVGQPGLLARFRLIQLITLLAGLVLLGWPLGIAGVALAVDLMLLVGIGQMLWRARDYVDYSLTAIFAIPLLAVTVGLTAGFALGLWPPLSQSLWLSGIGKAASFSALYGFILLIWDRPQLLALWAIARRYFLR